jgi:hypothetical protein
MHRFNKSLFSTFLLIYIHCNLCYTQVKEVEIPLKLGDNISLVKTENFYDRKVNSPEFSGQIPNDLVQGDLILIIVGCSGGLPQIKSKGWEEILSVFPPRNPDDINVSIWYKMFKKDDPATYKLTLANRNFITIVVLRGIDSKNPVVDKLGVANSSKEKGVAIAPSVKAEKGGVTLVAFTFDDPYKVWVKGMHTIFSNVQGGDGQAVAIKYSDTNGQTGPIKTTRDPQDNPNGGGDEVAATITLRAKK